MSKHTVTKCRRCETVLLQCRCIGPHEIEWGECRKFPNCSAPERPPMTPKLTPEGAAARERWCASPRDLTVAERWNAIAAAAIEASDEVKRLRHNSLQARRAARKGDLSLVDNILTHSINQPGYWAEEVKL